MESRLYLNSYTTRSIEIVPRFLDILKFEILCLSYFLTTVLISINVQCRVCTHTKAHMHQLTRVHTYARAGGNGCAHELRTNGG